MIPSIPSPQFSERGVESSTATAPYYRWRMARAVFAVSFAWTLQTNSCAEAFVISSPPPFATAAATTLRRTVFSKITAARSAAASSPTALALLMADAEMEHKEKRSSSSDTKKEGDWTPVVGGFLPNLFRKNKVASPESTSAAAATGVDSATKNPKTIIRQVQTIHEYKTVVVDETECITVVRFYAPWCRACKAVQAQYRRLALQYANTNNHNNNNRSNIQFVEVPVTKDNAVLHQGLGVPSLPYGHIYHPRVGLVEELKINKACFPTFESIIETYVQGYCNVTYQDEEQDELPPLQ